MLFFLLQFHTPDAWSRRFPQQGEGGNLYRACDLQRVIMLIL